MPYERVRRPRFQDVRVAHKARWTLAYHIPDLSDDGHDVTLQPTTFELPPQFDRYRGAAFAILGRQRRHRVPERREERAKS